MGRPRSGDPGPGSGDVTAPATERGRGRELALAALCHLEGVEAGDRPAALEQFWRDAPRDEEGRAITAALDGHTRDAPARNYARRLLERLLPGWAAIDSELESVSRRWRLERMDKIDRNVLRIAAAELDPEFGVPPGVVVAEAVRVAARYGSERSGRFVNGLLSDLAARRGDRGGSGDDRGDGG